MKAPASDHRVSWPVHRASHLLRAEGLAGLVAGVFRHLEALKRRILWSKRFVVYSTSTAIYDPVLAAPSGSGPEVYVLERDADAERLAAAGYEDVRRVVRSASRRLEYGAVAFCAFVQRELAHVSWVGLTEPAMRSLTSLPVPVRLDEGEGYWGAALTMRRFRRLGLYKHVMNWRLWYSHEHGCPVLVDATAVDNVASLRGHDAFDRRLRGVYLYRRRLWWSDWKELIETEG